MAATPQTLGELRQARLPVRTVKQESRENLVRKLRAGEPLFPGIIGYDETVIPQLVNAVLSRHNFILLGLRGQAKSRILRGLIDLLDEQIPAVPGCEIHDDPLAPLGPTREAIAGVRGSWLEERIYPGARHEVLNEINRDEVLADVLAFVDRALADLPARARP